MEKISKAIDRMTGSMDSQTKEKANDTMNNMVEKMANLSGNEKMTNLLHSEKIRSILPKPTSNRAIVYESEGKVSIKDIGYPKMVNPLNGSELFDAVIIKVVCSAICGSDCHMFRGRTAAESGLVMGHEVTGEIIEMGPDVQFLNIGDLVSVPSHVCCGACRNCKERKFSACLNTNPEAEEAKMGGGIFGYAAAGGWAGGMAEYMLVPWADFNLLKIPNKEKSMHYIKDLAFVTDILPTAMHGCMEAKVRYGKTVFIAGAGPVGLCAIACCNLLGAAAVIVSDIFADRLQLAKQMGAYTIDLNEIKEDELSTHIKTILGCSTVDCAMDCVGYEATGTGQKTSENVPTNALNQCFEVVKAGGAVGVLGVYFLEDPKGPSEGMKKGKYTMEWGKAWMKGIEIATGQAPMARYNRRLMMCILNNKLTVHKALNVNVISLNDVPRAFTEMALQGAAKKFLVDPHGMIGKYGGNVSESSSRMGGAQGYSLSARAQKS